MTTGQKAYLSISDQKGIDQAHSGACYLTYRITNTGNTPARLHKYEYSVTGLEDGKKILLSTKSESIEKDVAGKQYGDEDFLVHTLYPRAFDKSGNVEKVRNFQSIEIHVKLFYDSVFQKEYPIEWDWEVIRRPDTTFLIRPVSRNLAEYQNQR